MQDFQSVPELARNFLSADAASVARGGGSAEIRRLRGYSGFPPPLPHSGGQQLPVKCPRCDSTNTKFCYYNNYNLAQPRHFCKSCRRYWTKGGVLRNVPVGGGCRKSKRSSSTAAGACSTGSSKTSSKNCSSSSSADKGGNSSQLTRHHPSASTPSSDASSAVPTAAAFAEPIFLTQNAGTNLPSNQNTIFDAVAAAAAEAPLCFQEAPPPMVLTSLMTTATVTTAQSPEFLGFGFQQTSKAEEVRGQLLQDQQQTQPQISHGFAPPALASMEQPAMGSSAGGLETLDWPGAVVDPAFFDLSCGGGATADPGLYWNQSHWADTDPSLYLP